jgi:hypothetical protein
MIIKDAIRDACIEFCQRTQLLTETVAVAVIADEAQVELVPAAGQHWEVLQILRDTAPLTPASRHALLTQGLNIQTGVPQSYYLEGDTRLVLAPTPETAETLNVLVTVRPADDATEVEDVLWAEYRVPIAAGARAWVRRHYGEWINPQSEAEDRAIFERAIHNQNIRRARGGASAPLRVRSHPF